MELSSFVATELNGDFILEYLHIQLITQKSECAS
jgi:hypothetical protein